MVIVGQVMVESMLLQVVAAATEEDVVVGEEVVGEVATDLAAAKRGEIVLINAHPPPIDYHRDSVGYQLCSHWSLVLLVPTYTSSSRLEPCT